MGAFRRILPTGALLGIMLFLVAGASAWGQEFDSAFVFHDEAADEIWRAGVLIAASNNMHTGSVPGIQGVPTCFVGYEGAEGYGITLGGVYEHRLGDILWMGVRGFFATYGGSLFGLEDVLLDVNGDPVDGVFEHEIEASIGALGLEPIVLVSLSPTISGFVGGRLDYTLYKQYHQEERIASPENVVFENDERVRMVYDGDLPNPTSLQMSVLAGIRYEFRTFPGSNLMIAPEAMVWYGLTPIAVGEDWYVHGLRVGVELAYTRKDELPEFRDIIPGGPGDSPGTEEDLDERSIVPGSPGVSPGTEEE